MTKCEIAHSFIFQTLKHQLQVKILDKPQQCSNIKLFVQAHIAFSYFLISAVGGNPLSCFSGLELACAHSPIPRPSKNYRTDGRAMKPLHQKQDSQLIFPYPPIPAFDITMLGIFSLATMRGEIMTLTSRGFMHIKNHK